MSNFMEELWNSIFTAGPTPTLLIATNITFAALQLVLFVCLLATYSIHFFVLSFLAAGLWFAINWFANEVQIAQAKEEEDRKKKGTQSQSRDGGHAKDGNVASDEMDSGDDTETELERSRSDMRPTKAPPSKSTGAAGGVVGGEELGDILGKGAGSNGTSTSLAPGLASDGTRKRRSLGESTGDLSTDSEWEKVDDEDR